MGEGLDNLRAACRGLPARRSSRRRRGGRPPRPAPRAQRMALGEPTRVTSRFAPSAPRGGGDAPLERGPGAPPARVPGARSPLLRGTQQGEGLLEGKADHVALASLDGGDEAAASPLERVGPRLVEGARRWRRSAGSLAPAGCMVTRSVTVKLRSASPWLCTTATPHHLVAASHEAREERLGVARVARLASTRAQRTHHGVEPSTRRRGKAPRRSDGERLLPREALGEGAGRFAPGGIARRLGGHHLEASPRGARSSRRRGRGAREEPACGGVPAGASAVKRGPAELDGASFASRAMGRARSARRSSRAEREGGHRAEERGQRARLVELATWPPRRFPTRPRGTRAHHEPATRAGARRVMALSPPG